MPIMYTAFSAMRSHIGFLLLVVKQSAVEQHVRLVKKFDLCLVFMFSFKVKFCPLSIGS